MTLHEAMRRVLRGHGRLMSEAEIASEINKRGLYIRKKDNKPVPGYQIGMRARKYSHLFYEERGYIGLREWLHKPTRIDEPVKRMESTDEFDFASEVTGISFLIINNFQPIGIIRDLLRDGLPSIPELGECGLYAITIPEDYDVGFLEPSEVLVDGNVIAPLEVSELKSQWVSDVDIVYYGIACDDSDRRLHVRLNDLIEHGRGNTSKKGPHKGGEILWQLEGYGNFTVWILSTAESPAPRQFEKLLLRRFHEITGMLPFANRSF